MGYSTPADVMDKAIKDVHAACNADQSNFDQELTDCIDNARVIADSLSSGPAPKELLRAQARSFAYESGRLTALADRQEGAEVRRLTRPGAKLDDGATIGTVIASCVYCDDVGRDEYLIMRLMDEPPFYEVAHWDFFDDRRLRNPDFARLMNINEATEHYAQMGGDI